MSGLAHFAVLQKDTTRPPVESLKRAFASFNNLTEADAIRLAHSVHGLLMRQLRRDAAQALQRALHDENIITVLVAEDEMPRLPEVRALPRLEISPEALTIYDVLGRGQPVKWADISLIASGAVRHFEMTATRKEETGLKFNIFGGLQTQKTTRLVHKVQSDTQLSMEILLSDGRTRYRVEAEGFPFKYVLDRPDFSLSQKFIWLVREICRYAPHAMLNEGARSVVEGRDATAQYANPQSLIDEMVWLLWLSAQAQPPTKV